VLESVYVRGPLLTQDAALLGRIVPVGCGLVGVHTGYRGVRVIARTTRTVTVAVTATLGASTLQCPDASAVPAAGAPPAALQITLTRSAAGYRISDITR
jgi:hypothetical protein